MKEHTEKSDAEIIGQLRDELQKYLNTANTKGYSTKTREEIQDFGKRLEELQKLARSNSSIGENFTKIYHELTGYVSQKKAIVDRLEAGKKKDKSEYSEANFIESLHKIYQEYVAAKDKAASPPPPSISREDYEAMKKEMAEYYAKGPQKKPEQKKSGAQEKPEQKKLDPQEKVGLEQERLNQEQERIEQEPQEKIRQEAERVAKEKLAKQKARKKEISQEIKLLEGHIDQLGRDIEQKIDSIDRYKTIVSSQQEALAVRQAQKQNLSAMKLEYEGKIALNMALCKESFEQLEERDQEKLTAFFRARDEGDTKAEAKVIKEAARGKGLFGRLVSKKKEEEMRSSFESVKNLMGLIESDGKEVAGIEKSLKNIETTIQSDTQEQASASVKTKIQQLEIELLAMKEQKSGLEAQKSGLEKDLSNLKQELSLGEQDVQQTQQDQKDQLKH